LTPTRFSAYLTEYICFSKRHQTLAEDITLRPASLADAAAMADIYNYYVRNGTATFEERAFSVAGYENRLSQLLERQLPVFIAENTESDVLGFAYASTFNPRSAYRFTAEDSVYVHHRHARKGIGRKLLSALIPACREKGFKQMMAVIGDSGNAGSVQLHKALGFSEIGIAREVGYKFERWLDVVYMQRAL
jgi:L-amino acid N-acyltransferase YncA